MIALAKVSSCSATESAMDSSDCWQNASQDCSPPLLATRSFLFKHLPAEAAEEAVQEAVATAFVAYARLVSLGKEDSTCAAP